MTDFEILSEKVNGWTEQALAEVFDTDASDVTVEASMYSLTAGGKRIRPMLMYISANVLGADLDEVLPFAVSLEMIHTYSLIHDDLPCMDNDDLRRGMPTCHVKYGEGIAVLAGDNLLNRAYEKILDAVCRNPSYAKAGLNIARCAGIEGMIGGQSIDIMSEDREISYDLLRTLQEKKTGALIKAAVMTPYYMFEEKFDSVVGDLLEELSDHMGLSFQIMDDILDFTSDAAKLGKSVGKDERDNKSTFVTLLGIERAREELSGNISLSYGIADDLDTMGFDTSLLRTMIDFFAKRDY